MDMHTQSNLDKFYFHLIVLYQDAFINDPDYSYAASHTTPENLARKITLGLASGSANKDGKCIKSACKFFNIKHTYKAIREFFDTK